MAANTELAAQTYALIEKHAEVIASAVTKQIRKTVPSYEQIDRDAHTQGALGLLRHVGPLFAGEEPTELLRSFGALARLRIIAGIDIDDFVTSTLCILPVLRRFLLKVAPSTDQANAMYAEVERALIPFVGRSAKLYAAAMADSDALAADATLALWRASSISDMLERTVDDDPFIGIAV